jgi:acyl-CoA reductase-like NAD-dependent aldehyde dehydrogenase
MIVTAKNLINGNWEDAVTGHTFESINPANTSEVVGVVSKSEKADVDNAVDAARRAGG